MTEFAPNHEHEPKHPKLHDRFERTKAWHNRNTAEIAAYALSGNLALAIVTQLTQPNKPNPDQTSAAGASKQTPVHVAPAPTGHETGFNKDGQAHIEAGGVRMTVTRPENVTPRPPVHPAHRH